MIFHSILEDFFTSQWDGPVGKGWCPELSAENWLLQVVLWYPHTWHACTPQTLKTIESQPYLHCFNRSKLRPLLYEKLFISKPSLWGYCEHWCKHLCDLGRRKQSIQIASVSNGHAACINMPKVQHIRQTECRTPWPEGLCCDISEAIVSSIIS